MSLRVYTGVGIRAQDLQLFLYVCFHSRGSNQNHITRIRPIHHRPVINNNMVNCYAPVVIGRVTGLARPIVV